MHELERRISVPQLSPEVVDAEAPFADVCVVQQHDSPARELRLPSLEVVPHRLVRVEAVDVEQVDRSVLEVADRFVEGRPDQARERGVMPVVVCREPLEDLLAVEACVLVTLASVDRVARRGDPKPRHRLAQGEIRDTLLCAEFDEGAGTQRVDEPKREGDVLPPRRDALVVGQPVRGVREWKPDRGLLLHDAACTACSEASSPMFPGSRRSIPIGQEGQTRVEAHEPEGPPGSSASGW